MEQKIIEKPAFGEDDVAQPTETSKEVTTNGFTLLLRLMEVYKEFITNNNKKNTHTKHNKKEYYHRWTPDEDELIIRTVLIADYNNKRINWKEVAAELNNGCDANVCKAHYHKTLRQPLIQKRHEYESRLGLKDSIGDMKEKINCLTNAYMYFYTRDKTLGKEHLQK